MTTELILPSREVPAVAGWWRDYVLPLVDGLDDLAAIQEHTRGLAALQAYVKDREQSAEAAKARIVAELRIGELLGEALDHGGDRRSEFKSPGGLEDIPRQDADRFRLLADNRDYVLEKLEGGETSRKRILELIDLGGQPKKKREEALDALGDSIIRTDFREADLPAASFDLIFTDPPYDRDNLGLYDDLGRVAARVLVPGGSLIAYVGAWCLWETLDALRRHLRYQWQFMILHSGGSSRMFTRGIRVRYKPLLWFTKGPFNSDGVDMEDVIPSTPPDKTLHEWAQSEPEAAYLIDRLTPAGGAVLDPMCGSGTTIRAAEKMGRRAVGIELPC